MYDNDTFLKCIRLSVEYVSAEWSKKEKYTEKLQKQQNVDYNLLTDEDYNLQVSTAA